MAMYLYSLSLCNLQMFNSQSLPCLILHKHFNYYPKDPINELGLRIHSWPSTVTLNICPSYMRCRRLNAETAQLHGEMELNKCLSSSVDQGILRSCVV